MSVLFLLCAKFAFVAVDRHTWATATALTYIWEP